MSRPPRSPRPARAVPGPDVDLVPAPRSAGQLGQPAATIDPLSVPLSTRATCCSASTATMRDAGADLAEALYQIWDTAQVVRLQRGSPHRPADPGVRRRDQARPRSATARPSAARTRPHRGQYGTRGWELVARARPARPRARGSPSEAQALLTAPACPAGETTLILGSEQMALQIHESVGHAIELDRILGWEAAFAGTSWLDLAQLGSLRYGSELMNITIDPTHPGRARLVRLRRRGHPGRAAGRGPGRHLGRRAGRAGLGRGRRPRLRRQRAGRRLGPAADGADDQRRPASPARTRSRRSSPPPTTGSSWTPTGPGRSTTGGSTSSSAARSAGRSRTAARADAAQPDVHRHRPAVLALDGHARPPRSVALGHAQLRQGPTRPGRPHRPSRRAGPVPATSEWGSADDRDATARTLGRAGCSTWSGRGRRRRARPR